MECHTKASSVARSEDLRADHYFFCKNCNSMEQLTLFQASDELRKLLSRWRDIAFRASVYFGDAGGATEVRRADRRAFSAWITAGATEMTMIAIITRWKLVFTTGLLPR